MKFKDYILTFKASERGQELNRLAELLELSEYTMLSYYRGYRRIPVETVAELQRVTDRRVLLADEFPDLAADFSITEGNDNEAPEISTGI